MSSRASSTIANMPPRHGKKLADVMDEAFRNNNKAVDEANTERAPQGKGQPEAPAAPLNRGAETVSPPAKSQNAGKIKGYTFQMASVYPPQPCERCVRSKKTCLGIAGARCENCKTLHQKCSNSSGPPRGRHAAVTAGRQNSKSPSPENDDVSAEPLRTKRKQAAKAKQTDVTEGGEDEGASTPVLKKRRVSGVARANLIKDVAELEAAIKKLQSSVTRDLKHLTQLAVALTAKLNETD